MNEVFRATTVDVDVHRAYGESFKGEGDLEA